MFTTPTEFVSRRLGLSLAAGLAATFMACTCTAIGQVVKTNEPSPYKTPATKDKNAALEYLTLRDLFDAEMLKLAGEEWGNNQPGWSPSEKLTVMLEESQPLIRRLIEASKLPTSDFGIRYEDGFGALLPHLGHMRQFARVLGCDARRLAIAGRTDEAAERLCTCFRMAQHLTTDRVLISSLVSIAISSLALNQSETIARDYGLSESARREIIKTARKLLTDDPFGTRACIQMEKQLAVNSIKPFYKGQGENAGKELAKQFRKWQFDTDGLRQIEQLNEQQLDEQMDLLDRYYATLTNLWTAKDAEDRLKQLEERLTSGEFGLLVKNIAPALTKCRISTNKGIKEINDVTALLEAGIAPPPANPAPTEAEQDVHDGE